MFVLLQCVRLRHNDVIAAMWLAAVLVLQVAEQEAASLHTGSYSSSSSSSSSPCSTPVARALASVQLQLAGIELQLGALRIAHTAADREARRPVFPKVAGRDASPVIQYLEAMQAQVGGAAAPGWTCKEYSCCVLF